MVVDYFLFTIAIIWIIGACITDIKKREVANWLSFSLLAIALAVRAISSILTKKPEFFYALIGLAVFLILANLFYYTRIFGGGDAKLLIALGPVFGVYPSFISNSLSSQIPQLPFFFVFFLNLLIVGAIYGVIYSIVLTLKNRKKVFKEVKKIYSIPKLLFILALTFLFLIIFYILEFKTTIFFVLAIMPFILFNLLIYAKAVENTCMIKIIKTQELVEGDWLAQQIKIGKKILNPSKKGLDIKEIRLIRKNYKKIKIKEGLPFVPVFLIAAIISLFWGNAFIILVSLMI